MLDIGFIRQNPEIVRAAIKNKRLDLDFDALLATDQERRRLVTALDQSRANKNAYADKIPKASKEERPQLIQAAKELREQIEKLEKEVAEAGKRFEELMLRVPSIPRPEVPVGVGEEDNVEVRKVGEPRRFDFKPKDHVELMTSLGLVNW